MLVLEVAIHLSNAGVTRRIETLEAKEPGYLYYFAILEGAIACHAARPSPACAIF